MYKNLNEFLKNAKNLTKKPIGYIFDRFHYKTKTDNEFVGLGFILTPANNLKFNDNEVIDFQWLSPAELKNFLTDKNNCCAPLPLVFKKAEEFRKSRLTPVNSVIY